MSPKRYTIAVDFDGVLHPYTKGWVGETPDDEAPVAGALDAIKTLAETHDVVVFSTRCGSGHGLRETWQWLDKHGFAAFVKDVSCTKPGALAYIDDRAVPFNGDWSEALASTRELVKRGPWSRRQQQRGAE